MAQWYQSVLGRPSVSFFHCLLLRDISGGIPAAKTPLSGEDLGQSHCPTLISYKGPSSIIVRAKSFYALLYGPHEKQPFESTLQTGRPSGLKDNKEA